MQLTTRARLRERLRRAGRDDGGLTLIELLITIVIMGIITIPLAGAMIVFFGNSDKTVNRLSDSNDAQAAASYFAQDVESIGRHDWATDGFPLVQSIEQNVAATGGIGPCGTAETPTALIRFLWDDPSAAQNPPVVRVSYIVQTVGGQQQLRRIKCVGSATIVQDVVLVHNLSAADTPTCTPGCTGVGANAPKRVTFTIHIRATPTTPVLDVTLTGQRRQT